MPADPESTSWANAIVAALGVGGGGGLLRIFTTQAAQAVKQKELKERADEHSVVLDKLTETGTRLETTMTGIDEDISEMKGGIKKLVDHVTGTHLG